MQTRLISEILVFYFPDQPTLAQVRQLSNKLSKTRAVHVVFSFRDVRHIHYQVAKAIIGSSQEISRHGIKVNWFNLSSHVRQIFMFAKELNDRPELFTGKHNAFLS
ncbi:MAG: hypothetical protein KBA26_09630 [Candidatus Delongbacteria bacterium]|nr:hypothetical protein [Candidatus Delongbacteria bacterium]